MQSSLSEGESVEQQLTVISGVGGISLLVGCSTRLPCLKQRQPI